MYQSFILGKGAIHYAKKPYYERIRLRDRKTKTVVTDTLGLDIKVNTFRGRRASVEIHGA